MAKGKNQYVVPTQGGWGRKRRRQQQADCQN